MSDYPSWITYAPLQRNWDQVRKNSTSRLCSIKAIAIHYTAALGQKAVETRAFLQTRVSDSRQDLEPAEQGSPLVGAHFIIDDTQILALAPSPNYVFYHVGDQQSKPANRNCWADDRTKYVRGGPNYYSVGIEHCYTDPNGKFSSAVLKQSHKLVRWLMEEYGTTLLIGRHYDFTGKACPGYYAPVLRGKNDQNGLFRPEFPNEILEVQNKTERWRQLLSYYKQSNANNIPAGIL